MKVFLAALALICTLPAMAQTGNAAPATLKSVLLNQLKSTHSKSDWFVCANVAVAGLTPEQANWHDSKGNHSAGQIAYHILFWNKRSLANFQGHPLPEFKGENAETFDKFDAKSWDDTVKQLDQVMTDLETLVAGASDEDVAKWAPTLANIATHNAYHIGEIVMVRKEQGVWDPNKGVK